ncbi:MAG TPA: anti-sigma factor RsbA family regulatory protein [Solirubrobacteraceae bacterium]|nr:anti-sigma factor RsbA family regulatory protein [Solirubrobacteraceae bacterium]
MALLHDATRLRHEAFVYETDDDFVGRIAPHLRLGLEENEAPIAVLTRSNRATMREALGPDYDEVLFLDCDGQYLRPARTLAAYDSLVRQIVAERATTVRVVAEMPPSQYPAEGAEWLAYEAIFNRALAHLPVSVVCLYDARVVSESVVDAVWRTHPWSFADAGAANERYEHPEHAATALTPAARSAPGLEPIDVGGNAGAFRERLAAMMVGHGVPQAGVVNMLIAATEIADNAERHGEGLTRARAGLVDGRFVCEVSDEGCGLDDPMAGYYPPGSDRAPGKGMWVARQLMFRVDVLAAAPGTTVRLWL